LEKELLNAELLDLFDNAPCGFHCLDVDGFFIHINNTELRWLGYRRDEILGRKRFSDILVPESRKVFDGNLKILIQNGSLRDVEYQITCKNGKILSVLLNATAIYDRCGKFVMTRSVLVDITEILRAEKVRLELSSQLQVAHEEIKTLRGLLPTCAYCKRIKDDKGAWKQMETYISAHSEARFSHGICPDCMKKYYREYFNEPPPK